MKKKLFVVVLLLLVAAGSYTGGYLQARNERDVNLLAQALDETALCANGLNTLGRQQADRTARLLDHRLRSALELAEANTHAIAAIDTPIPNLIGGVERAKVYADRIGDAELSRRLAELHQKLTARG